jgi:uncharacterized membrane protein
MNRDPSPEAIAARFFGRDAQRLGPRESRVVEAVAQRQSIVINTNEVFEDTRTLGERLADRIATFGGSWTFILSFGFVLASWVTLNTFILSRRHETFDPYPYILLNLFLSMLAALQAPVIMMSQNRQAAKDRMDAAHDYEVNLKAEIEIRGLHDKIDELRERHWVELVEMQQQQIKMLGSLVAGGHGTAERPLS